MAQQGILDKLRELIGAIAFGVLLWSLRMTADEYYDEQTRIAEQHNDAETGTCPSCSGYGSYLVGAYHETCPVCEGTGHV